jgi:DNA polymerase-3 subunit delta'
MSAASGHIIRAISHITVIIVFMPNSHNWPVVGHDWAIDFLQRSMQHRRNRHAYLITGLRNIGKNQLAHAFAMALNCRHDDEAERPCGECRSCRLTYSGNHPDMLYAEHDERTNALKIDAIRDITQKIALKPYDSRYRIALFADFDAARPQAQDALLKTLEEPPEHAVLILMAPGTENIMPTITSRCQIIPLRPVDTLTIQKFLTMHGADDERAQLLARLSSGRIGWALEALQNESVMEERDDILDMLETVVRGNRAVRFDVAADLDKIGRDDRMTLQYLLEMWQSYWRDILLLAHDSPIKPCNSDRRVQMEQLLQRATADDILKALQSTRELLTKTLNTNANLRMALEVLFLDYPGLDS